MLGTGCGLSDLDTSTNTTSVDKSHEALPNLASSPTTDVTEAEVPNGSSETVEPIDIAEIRELLSGLTVDDDPEPRAPYERNDWPTWRDIDGDGCDAREQALKNDSKGPVEIGENCEIKSGLWISPYDEIKSSNPADLEIDHIVPLAEAHRSGGWQWGPELRITFANDPSELVVTSRSSNRSKGSQTPDQWRPENNKYWCTYATKWVSIKLKYRLTVTTAERDALGQMLEKCPASTAIAPSNGSPTQTVQPPSPTTTAEAPLAPLPSSSVHYKSCSEARAAGVTPIYEGQPGYGKHLDGDGDGIACE